MTCETCRFYRKLGRKKMCLNGMRAFIMADLERKACGNCGTEGRNWMKKDMDIVQK